MKTLSNLTLLLLFVLLITGCGDSGSDDPTPDAATFKVDLQQSGDYEKFTRLITISGGNFYETGTQEEMPTILYNDDLTGTTYSYEAEGVRELNVVSTIGFSPIEDAPAEMQLKVTVYRNDKLLAEKTYTYTEESDGVQEELTYKAK
ncbi:hypothetical protein CLV24_105137 [Pontibacter ummariensis]|uniref:Uncharacterized protein n=1 Tax=Pontibacter ummariensis TaxID=1610492 RepID=A0A239DTR0_9BACT|nr:hypothetical protein [Pontibacter ummariensis]PRY13767.1 hypothetical protein CLV24_105137 [Pontibacter ummariensis]SNS35629.1 hypothetical protein SAMN06296052_105115 [Pontibacter ummariensis]